MRDANPDLQIAEAPVEGGDRKLTVTLTPQAERTLLDNSVKQNITTLHNRINELGVSEPVIAQQGADRIVVQLPGVQDTARAKDILGRTATLEVRLVDESSEGLAAERGTAPVPFGSERYLERDGRAVIVKRGMWSTVSPQPSPGSPPLTSARRVSV
jgi:preprotein translocase subunit SecD